MLDAWDQSFLKNFQQKILNNCAVHIFHKFLVALIWLKLVFKLQVHVKALCGVWEITYVSITVKLDDEIISNCLHFLYCVHNKCNLYQFAVFESAMHLSDVCTLVLFVFTLYTESPQRNDSQIVGEEGTMTMTQK